MVDDWPSYVFSFEELCAIERWTGVVYDELKARRDAISAWHPMRRARAQREMEAAWGIYRNACAEERAARPPSHSQGAQ